MKIKATASLILSAALFLVCAALLIGCTITEVGTDNTGSLSYVPATDSPKESTVDTVPQADTSSADSTAEIPTQSPTEAPTEEKTEPPTEAETTTVPVETEPPHVAVTDMTLTHYELHLLTGESFMPIVTMYPENAADKGEIWTSSDTTVAAVDIYGNVTAIGAGQCTVTVTSTDNPAVSKDVSVTVSIPPETTHAATDAPPAEEPAPEAGLTYVGGILIVNKTYSLPADYNPGADPEALAALNTMFSAAASEGLSLWVKSGFRSYNDQLWQYNYYAERDGVALADTYSARAGHSEHQSGLAFDLNSLYTSFADTAEGQWLAANCHKYGFIIRYPAGKEHLTGYMYEPWHVRYLGVDNATAVFESGLCLEEYLGITSYYH